MVKSSPNLVLCNREGIERERERERREKMREMSTQRDGGGDKRTRQLSTLYTWQEVTTLPRQDG